MVQADAYDLGNVKGSFDVAFSADWWSHIPRQTIPLFMDALTAKLHDKSKIIFIDMTMIDYFRQEPSVEDEHGNRVSLRVLPDGSEYRVIKNFPDEAELRHALEPYGKRIVYYDFPQLVRWMAAIVRP